MSTFDAFKDSPVNEIRTEGQEIELTLTKTSATTARISWNIPNPFEGCTTDGSNQVYNGIVITLDGTPANVRKSPTKGTKYTADPTADINLHAGDKIDSALVIGAFYDDKTTTFLDITGLDPNTPYYISGYAVDNVLRYHLEGVHAYSLDYGNQENFDINGYQIIDLMVEGTFLTALSPTINYEFRIDIDDRVINHPVLKVTPTIDITQANIQLDHTDDLTITINGSDAVTYDDLISELNKQLSLIDNPPQVAGIPNAGAYYINNNQLLQWNGAEHVQLDVIIQPTDPTITAINALWHDVDDHLLYKYDGTNQVVQTNVVDFLRPPTEPTCDDFWRSATDVYRWNGTVWELKTLRDQATDPSLPPTMTCPFYWYDEVSMYLYEWSEEISGWNIVDPIMWPTDPTIVVLDDYWYDTETSLVMQWDTVTWVDTGATIASTAPGFPMDGALWYDIDTEELFKYNSITSTWDLQIFKVAPFEPNNPPSAGIWWDTTLNQINVWDITTTSWDTAPVFVDSATDPSLPPTLTANEDIWDSGNILYNWDGAGWVQINYMEYPTDPTLPNINDYWYNTVDALFYQWDGTLWNVVTLTESNEDPYAPIAGDYWYDGTTLFQWSGVAWVGLLFAVTPYTPTNGDRYFDTVLNQLFEWQDLWVQTFGLVVAGLYKGNLRFSSRKLGSSSAVAVNEFNVVNPLFSSLGSLGTPLVLNPLVLGLDGVDPQPTYMQIGVGNDGSPDERRELIDSIRAQLGYPVVDVELTKYQWDQCVNRAIEELRARSSSAYRRAYFFMDMLPGQQTYSLTDETVGFHKIVSIMDVYRTQSSFLGNAAGQGVYGQLLLQHLYQLGTFDLVSYYMVNEYVETMGQLFASGIQYHWYEDTREILILQTMWTHERILLDVVVERSEQELIKDRYLKNWIERWASAEARQILSEIRGKYVGLPGAGGGVSLNAQDLIAKSVEDKAECLQMIEDYVADNKENIGMSADFLIG